MMNANDHVRDPPTLIGVFADVGEIVFGMLFGFLSGLVELVTVKNLFFLFLVAVCGFIVYLFLKYLCEERKVCRTIAYVRCARAWWEVCECIRDMWWFSGAIRILYSFLQLLMLCIHLFLFLVWGLFAFGGSMVIQLSHLSKEDAAVELAVRKARKPFFSDTPAESDAQAGSDAVVTNVGGGAGITHPVVVAVPPTFSNRMQALRAVLFEPNNRAIRTVHAGTGNVCQSSPGQETLLAGIAEAQALMAGLNKLSDKVDALQAGIKRKEMEEGAFNAAARSSADSDKKARSSGTMSSVNGGSSSA